MEWDLDIVAIYMAVVLAVGMLTLLRVLYWLRKSEQTRKRQAALRNLPEAVRTSSPVDDPDRLLKERAIASIESRFTVTKRLIVPLVFVVTGTLLSLPFLSEIPAALVSLVAAVITVGLGVAARPVVENAIAGLMISFSKLFRVGDTVKLDDMYGTIEDITITHTTMKVWDWRRYVVPNGQMLQARFVNYTLFDSFVWAHVEFWVSYDSDIEQVREIALTVPPKSRYFAEHEMPRFWIMDMDKEGIRCWIAAWANGPSDGWMLTHDIRTEMIRRFRALGIQTHGYRYHLDTGEALGGATGRGSNPPVAAVTEVPQTTS
jgi:small-conductance mechanosensitive channel